MIMREIGRAIRTDSGKRRGWPKDSARVTVKGLKKPKDSQTAIMRAT